MKIVLFLFALDIDAGFKFSVVAKGVVPDNMFNYSLVSLTKIWYTKHNLVYQIWNS